MDRDWKCSQPVLRFPYPGCLSADVLKAFATGDEMKPLSFAAILAPVLSVCIYLAPLAGNADSAAAQANVQSKRPSHRSIRQGMFALSKIDFAPVVMLGDSLTEHAQWSEITGCRFVVNRGIGADDSAGVLRRLDDVTKLRPSAVFLMIGVNDVASGVPTETIVDNVHEIIDRLTKAGARVYLTLVLHVTESYARKINPKVDELNAAYKLLAEQNKISLVDFRPRSQTGEGFLRAELSTDGIHLTAEGYREWRDAITPYVLEHCSPESAPTVRAEGRPKRTSSANSNAADKAAPKRAGRAARDQQPSQHRPPNAPLIRGD
jgi:lysophospholipase L1-like esterase